MDNMKKCFIVVMMALLPLSNVQISAEPWDVTLEVCYGNPSVTKGNIHKSPIRIPQLSLDGYTLTFTTPCDGCTLRLLNAEGEVDYDIVIPESTTTLTLPSYLSGEYEIQIIRGNYCFYGYITL